MLEKKEMILFSRRLESAYKNKTEWYAILEEYKNIIKEEEEKKKREEGENGTIRKYRRIDYYSN